MSSVERKDDTEAWKEWFRVPVILWAQVARADPTRGLVCTNRSGIYQLYAWDVPTGDLRQLTDRPEGVRTGYLAPDGRDIYYLADERGNEIGHYVRIPFEGGSPTDVTPDLAPYASFWLSFSCTGNTLGLTVANTGGFHVYTLVREPSGMTLEPRQLYQSSRIVIGPVLSHRGELAAVGSSERSGTLHFSVLGFDTAKGHLIGELWDGPGSSVEPVAFAPLAGDARLLVTSNRTGRQRPLIWNVLSGERTDLPLEDLDGDIIPLDWSPDGSQILLYQDHHAVEHLFVYDLTHGRLQPLAHPPGVLSTFYGLYGRGYFAPTGEIYTIWQDAIHPPRLIALDANAGTHVRTMLAAGDVPLGRSWESISFRSSDGQPIQGWLGIPDGPGPFPMILHMHGGPHFVMHQEFSPEAQTWLDHGFGYLTINYRGSTTFGRDFQEQIWGQLGHWELEDMVAAHDWLLQQGIAHPDQILLAGWSYGGYLTLWGLGKRPELWAGGLAGVAIADYALTYEDAAATLCGYFRALMGGTPDDQPEQYAASSPSTYAERVRAPVFIIQGRNDTRCPARQMEVYETKMRALGKAIEVHWVDAGHTGPRASIEQAIAYQEQMLRFALRVIGSG